MFSRMIKFTHKIGALAIPRFISMTNCEKTKIVILTVAPSISKQKQIMLTVTATYHHKVFKEIDL